MVGDTSRSERRQGESGRPRRRCLGVDDGVEKSSITLWEHVRIVGSDVATSSDFGELKRNMSVRNKAARTDLDRHSPFLHTYNIE